ncbi:MAG: YcjX family protein [Kiritimatiellae bacterium]|jgi:predicted YcjX-like family ATPase|nr:YcjX family protein [Kiritimatiellia bacterium]
MQIGITGLANGGKTVFLTSLLWHLSELGASDFILDGNVGLTDFRERPFREKGVDLFPFEEYRDALVRGGVWPSKTTDCYKYSCVFVREDWTRIGFRRINRMRKLKLSTHQYFNFFDFGGERIADAAIAGYKEYADWSDHMFRHFRSHADYRQAVGGYLKILEKLMSIEHNGYDEVVHSYKLTLSALIHGYKPLISPSTFLLDTSGSVAAPASDEALAESRFSGLDKDCQFAPLPSDFRQKYPAVAHKMSKYYQLYRKEVALPLFKEIGKSKRLVVLVDIPSLLAGGVGRYNDNRQIMLDLFDALRKDSYMHKLLHKLLSFWTGDLKKVAFVATKADLVRGDDVQDGRLEGLLRQMTIRAQRMLPDVEFGWFVCSAVVSTRQGKDGKLIGRTVLNNPEQKEVEFSVPKLPECWPDDWAAGEYPFVSVLPKVAKNLQIPPGHYGMDRLFDFLI